jgi:multicomponent Na+:H+ antiporter subunit F
MVETGAKIAIILIVISFIMAFYRVLKGPSLPDRVVALDFMASLSMGFILTYSILKGEVLYIDIVLIISLVLFMGTVTVAKYLRKKED